MSKTGKIVIWAVVAAVLTGILIWGLAGKASFGAVWGNFADTVKNLKVDDFVDRLPDDAQTGEHFEKAAEEIESISMRFVDESITIVPTDGDVIRVEETSSRTIKNEDVMHYGTKNGELVVQSGRVGRVFGWTGSYGIDVRVMIPRSFAGTVDIETVSGPMEIGETNAASALYGTTSGDISVSGGTHRELRIDSVSGSVGVKNTRSEKLEGGYDVRGYRSAGQLQRGQHRQHVGKHFGSKRKKPARSIRLRQAEKRLYGVCMRRRWKK